MESVDTVNNIIVKGMTPLLQVFDMPVSLRFYRDLLGFELVDQSSPGDDCDWVLLRFQGIELMLNTAYEKENRPTSPDKERWGGHQDTALYFGCPDVETAFRFLRDRGVEVKAPFITGYQWKAIDFPDPDGYQLVFHWPLSEK